MGDRAQVKSYREMRLKESARAIASSRRVCGDAAAVTRGRGCCRGRGNWSGRSSQVRTSRREAETIGNTSSVGCAGSYPGLTGKGGMVAVDAERIAAIVRRSAHHRCRLERVATTHREDCFVERSIRPHVLLGESIASITNMAGEAFPGLISVRAYAST